MSPLRLLGPYYLVGLTPLTENQFQRLTLSIQHLCAYGGLYPVLICLTHDHFNRNLYFNTVLPQSLGYAYGLWSEW